MSKRSRREPVEEGHLHRLLVTIAEALKRSWEYMLVGIVIAGLLFWLSRYLRSSAAAIPTTSALFISVQHVVVNAGTLFHHLAVGFVVSSISVFFYEWGSHVRNALQVSNQLAELLRTQGEAAVARGMEETFGDRRTLREFHGTFISTLKELDRHENLAREADVEFLTLFVRHAARYGEQLKTLRDHLKNPDADEGRPFHLDFTKLAYADKILTHWMGLLGEGDSYLTFSNPRTWSALQEGNFKEAGKKAVAAGAMMKRIFIMGRDDDIPSREDLRNLIEHYQFAADKQNQGKGSYQIQIAETDVFRPGAIKPEDQHYGIFRARFGPNKGSEGDGRTSVAFKVKKADVEEFELVAVPKNAPLERNFNEIWDSLEYSNDGPLVKDGETTRGGAARFLDAIVSRDLAYLKRDPRGNDRNVRIDILSTFETWQNHYALPKLYEVMKGITIRHLFIIDEGQQVGGIEENLKTAAGEVRPGQEPWCVQVCGPSTDRSQLSLDSRWLKPRWQFIETKGAATGSRDVPLHECVFNLDCSKDLSDFFLDEKSKDSPMKAADYMKNFNRLWNLPSIKLK